MDEETPAPSLSWLGDDADDEHHADPRRRRVLLVAATLPWLVLAYLLLRPAVPAPPPAPLAADPSGGTSPSPTDDVSAGPSTAPTEEPAAGTATAPVTSRVIESRARGVPGRSEAGALAVLAARAWLTGAPRGDIGDLPPGPPDVPEDAYLEHVAVEAVDWPAPGALVVTLVAVLLRSEGGEYRDVQLERLAVPVALERDGPSLGGRPWWLEAPEPSTAVVEPTDTVDDPDLLAGAAAAVADAGIEGELATLERTDGWPLLATVRRDGDEHRLWLRAHLDRLVVAGTLPRTSGDGQADTRPTPAPSGASRTPTIEGSS